MKKLFYLLLAMMLIGVSCEDGSNEVDSTPEGVVFADGTEMSAEFGSSGGSKSFSFSSDLDWEVTTSADWISVTPSSGTPSVKKFTVKASANDSFEERSGTVTMITTDDRSYTIEVTQAAENETFTINGNGEYEVSATGGEVEVKVTTNLEYTVEIPAEAKAWLSVADTRAVREETLTFTVAENASFDERSATVELKGADGKVLQSIVFKQKGEEKVFDTDDEGNYIVEAAGGEVEVKVATNLEYTVEIPAEAKEWLSVADTRAVREETLTFTVAENETFDERSATVELKGADGKVLQSIVFKQKGEEKVFDTDGKGNYVVEAVGGVVEVKVTTNLEYTVEIPAEAKAWLSVADTRAVREETLTFTVAENASFDERSATVELKGADGKVLQSIVFKQKGEEKVFDTDGEGNYVVEAVGGVVEVKVTTNLEYTVEIPAEAKEWLSVADTRAVIREETLTFIVAKNTLFDERSATVELKGADGKVLQSISFKQKGEEKVFDTDGEGNYIVEGIGGVVEVKVTTNLEYTVEIPAEAKAWLSIADTRAVREETLIFTVAKNETFDERSATVELKGADGEVLQSISFKQKEYEGTIEVDEEYVVDAEGGELEVKLSTDIDFTTSIPEEAKSWISIVETRSMRSESLTFNIAINDDVKERSATINLQNAKGNDVASFVIRQKGADAVLELKNQYSISNMGGNFEVAVTTNLEYEVEISADATSWLSYVETRALRTDKLIFNASHNEGEAERSGTIKLIGEDNEELQVITVTQRGNIFGFAYTTNDGKPLDPYITEGFGGEFVENIYDAATGCGVLKFAGAVTTIPEQAFGFCENLTRIDIPEGITTIGKEAFMGCTALEELTIPSTLTSLDSSAFKNCSFKATINCENISFSRVGFTEVIIGDGVTTIGNSAFSNCDSLTSVTIPDSVTTIGNYAFYNCDSLTSISIPDSVTTIGKEAFYSCGSLKSVTIPDSVTTIGEAAFVSCMSLTEFKGKFAEDGGRCLIKDNTIIAYANASGTTYTIPDSVTTIGKYAFYGYGPKSVTIGDSVTTIEERAFYECKSLTSVTIGDSVTTIGELAFYDCESLTSVTIGDSVTTIGDKAFKSCIWLTSVTIPDSVTTIGNSAFYYCYRLTSVTIGDSVTTIEEEAFAECLNLRSVTIGDSVTTIGEKAFWYCTSLKSVYCKATTPPTLGGSYVFDSNAYGRRFYVPVESVKAYKTATNWSSYKSYIAGYDFEAGELVVSQIKYTSTTKVELNDPSSYNVDIISNEWNKTTGEGVITIIGKLTAIYYMAFNSCTSLTSITIPDSVTTIGYAAFANCSNLTSITIPDSVTKIGDYAFAYCSNLTSITNPDSVTTIGAGAFEYCTSLTSVTIPDSVTTIGEDAFKYCDSLTSVTIPDSVTTIGEDAFYNCDSLTSVYCKATTPPSLGGGAFYIYSNSSDPKIYVPEGSLRAYKLAENWSNYADRIVEYDYNSTVTISYTTSDGMPVDAKALIVSNSYQNGVGELTYIGKDIIPAGLFRNCDNLTSVTIPDSVTTIVEKAFYDCDSLTSVTIGNSVTTIGNYAFSNCDSLTSVTIGNSVTTIGNSAFSNCGSLTSVTIGDSVTTIGNYAFQNCNSLTSVTIGDSVTTIGNYAFYKCKSLTSITIPDSVTTIGDYAFVDCSSLTSVYCKATTPPSLVGNVAFHHNASDRAIYVPAASVEAYKSAEGWSYYADYIVGNDFSTTSIINYTTSDDQIVNARLPIISNTYSNGIGTIEFLGSVIPVRAFYDCSSLTSVTIGDSVTTIGEYAFAWCDSLTSITIPDSVTTIGEYAFAWCDSLTSITIPDSVTTIGNDAFYKCTRLTSVTIPDSVTTIGNYAFYDCKSLTSVYCEATTPPSLGGSVVFDYNASGRTIYVPAASVEAYKSAEDWSEYADAIVGYDFENDKVVE